MALCPMSAWVELIYQYVDRIWITIADDGVIGLDDDGKADDGNPEARYLDTDLLLAWIVCECSLKHRRCTFHSAVATFLPQSSQISSIVVVTSTLAP